MEPSPPNPDALPASPDGWTEGGIASSSSDPKERVQQAARPRRRGFRQFLIVTLAVVALLCLGGVGAAFVFYDKATKPDLRTPVVVTLGYLRAYLVDRDDVKAAEFQCGDGSGLKDVRALRNDVDSREKTYNVKIVVSVDGAFETSRSGRAAGTSADLVLTTMVEGQPQRAVEHWVFALQEDDGGWHICSGNEVA
jgi:hypothetical protein